MRLVHLAILISSLSSVSGRNGKVRLVSVPDTLAPSEGSEGTSPVKGPISAQSSSTSVSHTDDMTPINSAPEGAAPESLRKDVAEKTTESTLTSDGSSDVVPKATLTLEKVKGLVFWNVHDLTQPICKNCRALIDWEWILEEYGQNFFTHALLIIVTLVLIWMLGTTAQDFFVPPLLYWADRLQLPPEFAGATLLALGNGAPDIFAVCTAAHKRDLPLAMSEMLGSNMFTLCVTGGIMVLGCYCISAQAQAGHGECLSREVSECRLGCTLGIYFLTMISLGFILMYGQPTLLKAICLPLIYVVYLCMLWYLRNPDEKIVSFGSTLSNSNPAIFDNAAGAEAGEATSPPTQLQQPLAGLALEKDASSLQKAYWALGLPTYVLRWVCIPPVDQQWDPMRRLTASITPLGMLAFCIMCDVAKMQTINYISLIGFLMLASLAGACIYIGSDTRSVLPWFYPVLPLFALVASVIWMAVLAGEITALVEAIGYTMQVPRLRLGFTAIAWGNCLADFLVCLATLRQGHAIMAITAILAGPLIDDLIAFGIALIMVSWERGIPEICGEDCPQDFKNPLITSLVAIFGGAVLFCLTLRNRGANASVWSAMLFVWYIAFLVIVLVVQRVDAPQDEVKSS